MKAAGWGLVCPCAVQTNCVFWVPSCVLSIKPIFPPVLLFSLKVEGVTWVECVPQFHAIFSNLFQPVLGLFSTVCFSCFVSYLKLLSLQIKLQIPVIIFYKPGGMWQLGVSKSQNWSFNTCSMYPRLWKLHLSVVQIFRVYLYFNITLFSSKEGKCNLPIILEGARKNIVSVFIAIPELRAAQWLQVSVLGPLQSILQGGHSLGDWALRKEGGMDWEWQRQGRFVWSCFSSADCRWICCNLGMDLAWEGKGCQVPPVSSIICLALGEDGEGTLFE